MSKKIKEKENKVPLCLANASNVFELNEDFVLAEKEDLMIRAQSLNEEAIQVQGNVIIRFRPKPRLVVEVDSELNSYFDHFKQNNLLKVRIYDLELDCRVTNLTSTNFSNHEITLSSINDRTQHPEVRGLRKATFYVVNFPWCLGKGIRGRNNPNLLSRSRLKFTDEHWDVTLDKMENHKDLREKLKSSDGFAITYAGKVKKINGALFSSDELQSFVNKLYHFLCFARGSKTAPFYFQGYNEKNEVIWNDWSLRRMGGWMLTQDNWLCDQHAFEQLKELFPGWCKLMDDELGKNEIPKILYWYCYAGRNTDGAGTDGSLILAIAALELFSFNYLVRHTNLRSKEKYTSKSLSNNIYKILEELDIPCELPDQLNELHAYSLQKNWQTGPKVITEIRNEIVHPDRESAPNSHVCYEALQLALWYIEMSFLRLCNYKGVYSNRLNQPKWAGTVEQVPWAEKS